MTGKSIVSFYTATCLDINVTLKYYHWDKSVELFFNQILYCATFKVADILVSMKYMYQLTAIAGKPVQPTDWPYSSKMVLAIARGKYLKGLLSYSKRNLGNICEEAEEGNEGKI